MQIFKKRYIKTIEELAAVPIAQREHYYFDRSLLRQKAGFTRQNEPVVDQVAIEQAGIMCRPFWADEQDDKELDSEGRAFAAYRAKQPSFGLLLRQTALRKLTTAQANLPINLRIVLKASVRPLSVQREVFKAELALTKQKHPDWSEGRAYKHTLEYVTDPAVNLPPHASGGTIDIDLWDERSQAYADMGSPINAVDDSSWGDNTVGLTDDQIKNRLLLRRAMLDAGFANLASEWWHYSYGDQRWAVFYDQPQALYGAVKLDDEP